MSVAIGIHVGPYVMLASDTRTTYYPPGQPPTYSDGRCKLLRTKIGLITGTGFVPLLESVKSRLANDGGFAGELFDVSAIVKMIQDETARSMERYSGDARSREAMQTSTNWLMTFYGIPEGESVPRLRLATFDPCAGPVIARYEAGSAVIAAPGEEGSKEFTDACYEALKKLLNVMPLDSPAEDVQESISQNAALLCEVVGAYGDRFLTVSRSLHIGVTTPFVRDCQITDLIENPSRD